MRRGKKTRPFYSMSKEKNTMCKAPRMVHQLIRLPGGKREVVNPPPLANAQTQMLVRYHLPASIHATG
jgi:hypothetical protein